MILRPVTSRPRSDIKHKVRIEQILGHFEVYCFLCSLSLLGLFSGRWRSDFSNHMFVQLKLLVFAYNLEYRIDILILILLKS
ncbi:Uncharacterized protein HZ326_17576 [Fusarium oxysporum f. sp. albedinis]|nr:Uncharacterized protein HZ326_17576 [Fusarium oxysporum f. sp. albedinis]